MDAPVCRLCGAKHWSQEPHQFKGAFTAYGPVDKAVDVVVNKGDRGKDRHADKVGRRAYMREYMRRRRGVPK